MFVPYQSNKTSEHEEDTLNMFNLVEERGGPQVLQFSNGREVSSKDSIHLDSKNFNACRTNIQPTNMTFPEVVRQHRYSNRGRTPSVTTHITRSKINTPMFSRGKTPTGKHPRPQPTRPLGAVY
jgi:hypothetical protein